MNICFVNSTRKWGGVKSWTLDLAQGLRAKGHNILIVGRPGAFIEDCRNHNLDALDISFGPDFNPACIIYFLRLFRSQNIDLVVVNVGKDIRTAGIAARVLGIPVIHRVGLAGDMENTWKVRIMHKWIRPQMLVPCMQIKTGILKRLPYLQPQEIHVIHTGKEPVPTLAASTNTPLRLISTSQLNPDKGHEDILQALALLKNQGYHFTYHVAGTGCMKGRLKTQAENLGLADCVIWHGFVYKVRELVRTCDIFLLPSYSEGLPNALLEAMAEGLVCIARNVGGVAEVWPQKAKKYLLSSPTGPKDFAQLLQTLLTMPPDQMLRLRQVFWHQAQSNDLNTMTTAFEHLAASLIHPNQIRPATSASSFVTRTESDHD